MMLLPAGHCGLWVVVEVKKRIARHGNTHDPAVARRRHATVWRTKDVLTVVKRRAPVKSVILELL